MISDETELAENFNDYFVNIASKLKEMIEHNDFFNPARTYKSLKICILNFPILISISFLSSCQRWTFQNQLASMV